MGKVTAVAAATLLGVLVLLLARASAGPAAARPSPKYRLVSQTVFGAEPRQRVFVVITPEGAPGVTTPADLRRYVELTVPAGATLEWSPGCDLIGGDPLRSADELDAFAAFDKERRVHFVHVPAG